MNIRKWMMSNGLWVVVNEMPNSPLAMVAVDILGGSRVEASGEISAAHFLEHMLFRGSAKYPDEKTINQFIAKRGGETNAFTTYEMIGFYIHTFKEYIGESFDILSDMLFRSLLRNEDIELERGAILQEIKASLDDPDDIVAAAFCEMTRGKTHPLGRDIAGTPEDVRVLQRQNVLSYLEKYFYPGNMVLSVAGGVSAQEILNLAFEHFSEGSQKARTFFKTAEPTPSCNRTQFILKSAEQAKGMMGSTPQAWLSQSKECTHDRVAAYLLMSIFGGGLGSRLYTAVRAEKGLVYTIYSALSSYSDFGSFYVYFGADADKSAEAIAVTLKEMRNLLKDGITEEEIEKVKNDQRRQYAELSESSKHSARGYADCEIRGFDILPWDEYFKRYIERVSKSEIMNVAERMFKEETFKLAMYGSLDNYVKDIENVIS